MDALVFGKGLTEIIMTSDGEVTVMDRRDRWTPVGTGWEAAGRRLDEGEWRS